MSTPNIESRRCACMISPALRDLIELRKAQFSSVVIHPDGIWAEMGLLDRLDYGNGPVKQCDPSEAPPPPPDETEPTGRSKAKGMDFAAALRNDSDRKARERAELRAALAEFAPKRAPHPNKIQGVPPCPRCGSDNTWSRHKNSNGSRRRICKQCNKGYTFYEPVEAA